MALLLSLIASGVGVWIAPRAAALFASYLPIHSFAARLCALILYEGALFLPAGLLCLWAARRAWVRGRVAKSLMIASPALAEGLMLALAGSWPVAYTDPTAALVRLFTLGTIALVVTRDSHKRPAR